jgi:glycosyltransferase involved in cell wall biosynthesis
MMKIVFLHHANVCKGGIERMLTTKANLLAEQMGWEVVLLTYEQNGEPFPYPLSPKVRCVDLGVRLYSAYKAPLLTRYFKKRKLRRQLMEAIRDFLASQKADIIVCTDKDAHELNALFKAHTKEKLLIEAHTGMVDHEMQAQQTNNHVRRSIAKNDLWRLKKVVSCFDVLIALTADDARCWQPYVRTVVVPNSLPQYPDQPADLSVEKKHVIAVGRLDYQKGQDLLLTAWKEVEKQHPDWHLDIFGDGNEKDSLNAQRSMLNLQTVSLHSAITDIYSEYMKSDLLVCSSRWEAFGLVIIEAMSCGIPVVSFDCDNGPRNIIQDGEDGLLVRNGDTDELADKIICLIENKDMRQAMGQQAHLHAVRFKEESILMRYVHLYEQL